MSLQTASDIPLQITSENSRSERRISPSWTIAQLKARLEPITGIPASCQRLALRTGSGPSNPLDAANEEVTQLSSFPLHLYAEIHVRVTASHFSGRSGHGSTLLALRCISIGAALSAAPLCFWAPRLQICRFEVSHCTFQESRILNNRL